VEEYLSNVVECSVGLGFSG